MSATFRPANNHYDRNTGIAGPGGGTREKPVGTVWLAARLGQETRVLKRVFPGDRADIRARAAQAVLDLLRRLIGKIAS